MTAVGVVSDIHGNLIALRAALSSLRERGVERIVCAGDVVGYNPESNECVATLAALGVESIAGNHDLIAIGRLGFERCSDKPAFTLRRTRRDLGDSSREHLSRMPPRITVDDEVLLFHGSYDDPTEYLTSDARLLRTHARVERSEPRARVCIHGHTHTARLAEVQRGVVTRRDLSTTVDLSATGRTYYLNPGSIDASRKSGDRLAEFAILDTARWTAEFHAVPYDHLRVERDAERAGYRMSAVDRWLYRGYRVARRGRAFVARRIGLGAPVDDPDDD